MAKLVATSEVLAAFLAFDEAREWTPGGTVDCCLALAEWAIWLGYLDPVAEFRGAYEPGQGQLDMLARHGGAVELIRSQALKIGATLVSEPEVGCIGVVGSRTNPMRQFGTIRDASGWITRTPTGWHAISAQALEIWKI